MINKLLEAKAENLLKESDCFTVPVVITRCAEYLKLKVEEVDLDGDVSGFLVLNSESAVIGCNNKHGNERKRFTIAHEMAHYILHAKNESLFIEKDKRPNQNIMFRDASSSTGEFIQEREANAFAAALLMPQKLVEQELQNNSVQNAQDAITTLASKFQVSLQAMSIRLTNLDIIDYNAV